MCESERANRGKLKLFENTRKHTKISFFFCRRVKYIMNRTNMGVKKGKMMLFLWRQTTWIVEVEWHRSWLVDGRVDLLDYHNVENAHSSRWFFIIFRIQNVDCSWIFIFYYIFLVAFLGKAFESFVYSFNIWNLKVGNFKALSVKGQQQNQQEVMNNCFHYI